MKDAILSKNVSRREFYVALQKLPRRELNESHPNKNNNVT